MFLVAFEEVVDQSADGSLLDRVEQRNLVRELPHPGLRLINKLGWHRAALEDADQRVRRPPQSPANPAQRHGAIPPGPTF